MDDDTLVAEALVALADRAPVEPVGLAATVERRFIRRRHRRWTAAAVCAVAAVGLVMAVPVLGLRNGPWRVDVTGATPPPVDQVWPGSVIVPPTEPMNGRVMGVILPIDSTHLLVSADTGPGLTPTTPPPTTLVAVYDTTNRTYRMVTSFPQGLFHYDAVTVSDHWIVWAAHALPDNRAVIYRAPLAGGPMTLVATVDPASGPLGAQYGTPFGTDPVVPFGTYLGPLFATDTTVYWTAPGPDYGIMQQPLDGGLAGPVPGAAGMNLLYPRSPWAALVTTDGQRSGPLHPGRDLYVTQLLHNVVTGQDIEVHVPSGATSLQCTPMLCVGNAGTQGETGAFIQRPDGTERRPLAVGGDPVIAYPATAAGRTLLIVWHPDAGGTFRIVVVDPATGLAGSILNTPGLDLSSGTVAPEGNARSPFFYLGGVS